MMRKQPSANSLVATNVAAHAIPVSSLEELELHLEKIKKGELPDFFLTQQVGNMKGLEQFLYKLLGLSTEVR